MRMTDFSLYLITDRHQAGGRPLTEVVRASLEGGVRAVQLRGKDLPAAELYRLAKELRRLTSDFDATLIINDRPDIALAADADGVHIGVSSLPVAAARRILGGGRVIGYSAHAIDEALRAEADGADFVTFGPVYYTPSKAAYGAPCGVKKLAEAVSALKIPVIALGGISPANITEALSAGIHGIAVISAVLADANPRVAAASLLEKIEEYAQHP
ncbi:MAG: thiamine phosphate synthase [Desulfuromonadaceae bacterium]|nr:thiamine phosphate synthase [Desulfuromonadaceae bacterium]MDD2850119.1 thiamine phosphate synthase [Desulfuromonadaceae bacterium]MDD4131644.1 thiamine phosphate synthase [Desulfuromonadaceae bacterium]